MDNLAACPNCGATPKLEYIGIVRQKREGQNFRIECSCGMAGAFGGAATEAEQAWNRIAGLNLAATQYSESRDLWMGRARTAQDRIGQLEDILRSIGIAYSDYIRRPNEQTFMHLMDLARAALESEARNG